MERSGMDVRFVEAVPGRPTLLSVCFQYPDGSGGNVTTVDSAAALVSERDVDLVERWLSPTAIALAVPEVPLPVRRHLLRRATERGALRVASLTTVEIEEVRETGFLALLDLVSMNEDEASALAGAPFPSGAPEPFLERLRKVVTAFRAGVRVVVTVGARGAFAFDGTDWTHVPTWPVGVVSTAGAGDALLGGVLTGLAAGLPFVPGGSPRESLVGRPLSSAFELGVLVGAFKVTSPHTIPPDLSLDALVAFAREHGIAFGERLKRLLPADEEHRHAS
jgi:sugar/nucleoside kinase (ribokinase family)